MYMEIDTTAVPMVMATLMEQEWSGPKPLWEISRYMIPAGVRPFSWDKGIKATSWFKWCDNLLAKGHTMVICMNML
jgi:hypothetical protein